MPLILLACADRHPPWDITRGSVRLLCCLKSSRGGASFLQFIPLIELAIPDETTGAVKFACRDGISSQCPFRPRDDFVSYKMITVIVALE